MHLTIFKHHTRKQFFKVSLYHRFIEGNFIHLSNLKTGVGQLLGQFTIIGQQQHTGSISVEPSHGENPLIGGILYNIEYGFAALIVIGRSNKIFWFIQQYVHQPLLKGYLFTIKTHHIALKHFVGRVHFYFVVHFYLTCFNPYCCFPSAANTTMRYVLVKCHVAVHLCRSCISGCCGGCRA